MSEPPPNADTSDATLTARLRARARRLFWTGFALWAAGFCLSWVGHWLGWRWLQLAALGLAAPGVAAWWAAVAFSARTRWRRSTGAP